MDITGSLLYCMKLVCSASSSVCCCYSRRQDDGRHIVFIHCVDPIMTATLMVRATLFKPSHLLTTFSYNVCGHDCIGAVYVYYISSSTNTLYCLSRYEMILFIPFRYICLLAVLIYLLMSQRSEHVRHCVQ